MCSTFRRENLGLFCERHNGLGAPLCHPQSLFSPLAMPFPHSQGLRVFQKHRGHLLGGSVCTYVCSYVLEGGNGRMSEKADKWETREGHSPLISFLLSVLLVWGGRKSTLFLNVPLHTLLMSTILTFYLLISKPKGTSCLFPEIKNCMHNWSLSCRTNTVFLCFSQCSREIRGNYPVMIHDWGCFEI